MKPDSSSSTMSSASQATDMLKHIRRQRLMQISAVTAFGLFLALFVARSTTFTFILASLVCLLVSLLLAYKHKAKVSAYTFLGSQSAMLFALSLTGAGLFDLAILGFPGLLVIAAILGGVRVFSVVLVLVMLQCCALAWLDLTDTVSPSSPILSMPHVIFLLIILAITGFCIHILVSDIKRLVHTVQRENEKVQQSRAQVQHLANHDALTQLPNRAFGEILFQESLQWCKNNQANLALLFIDLDNFKPVNDALGHAAGDELLIQLTKRLHKSLTQQQHLIRFGGDEFLVLSPFKQDTQTLSELATELIEGAASVFDILQTEIVISASVGIACAPKDGEDFKTLCRNADIAMYEAKKNGRNTFYFYDRGLDQASEEKFRLLQLLRPAIKKKQFKLYYQPLVNLADMRIIAVEALVRWPQTDGEVIGPNQFIPLAESSGLINELGEWIIQQACLDCAHLRNEGASHLQVSVNISAVQFSTGKLKQIIEDALRSASLPVDALELELTESLLLEDSESIQQQLNQLSGLGVKIAIDDFGTGYSNLGYLHKFNANKLKIDRSFVTSMCSNPHNASLVSAIINMAAGLGLKTVAEGVEDAQVLEKLNAMKCDIGQGYYWSKPVPAESLAALLNNTKPI